MSISLMTAAFKAHLSTTRKFVLLALCDSANDQGECYPSVPVVMEKCSAGERTVQEAVAYLEREGFLKREFRTGRSTVYWIADPRNWRTPAAAAPPQQPHPTPAAAAPITITEPSIEPSRKQKKSACAPVAVELLIERGFDPDTAAEFIAHKAAMKAPLTPRAWADHLAESLKAGWTPQVAAEKVLAKSWKGFEAKYVAQERQKLPLSAGSEPAWRTEQRERTQAFAGSAAAKPRTTATIIEMEPVYAATRRLD